MAHHDQDLAAGSMHDVTAKKKKWYRSPVLTKYGAVRDLTTGGTGKASEVQKGKAVVRP